MENKEISKEDCGCSDDCCQPKKGKGKLWTKIVFIVVVLAAAAIVTVKLVNNKGGKEQAINDTISSQQTAGGGDTTEFKTCAKVCDPSQSGCCPQTKQ